ncbi:hypothetical protein KC19_7G062800 [Ceratodon purpureus]|uniref:Uncharacterized protein n=1 Tax=Ceratodon purpureus TaxID=3225 RepID=A0A8T0H593_CERPU|nr:hypothetical protein KC19_7G062800 [Ceratodon purpureus]
MVSLHYIGGFRTKYGLKRPQEGKSEVCATPKLLGVLLIFPVPTPPADTQNLIRNRMRSYSVTPLSPWQIRSNSEIQMLSESDRLLSDLSRQDEIPIPPKLQLT